MAKENVAELAAVRGSDNELEAYLNQEAQSMLGTSQAEILTSLGDLVSEVDRRAVDSALGEFIVRETAHSLSTGVWVREVERDRRRDHKNEDVSCSLQSGVNRM